jgi:hypothetical protein
MGHRRLCYSDKADHRWKVVRGASQLGRLCIHETLSCYWNPIRLLLAALEDFELTPDVDGDGQARKRKRANDAQSMPTGTAEEF